MFSARGRCRKCLLMIPLVLAVLAVSAGLRLARLDRLSAQICGATLRLHVVANSDTIGDQLCKLAVRDAVLEQAAPLLDGAGSLPEAAARLAAGRPVLEQAAARAAGTGQTVRVRLTEQHYPTTYWHGCRLPAGRYLALRVELGRAEGHNWFCVLYPTLGASGAEGGYSLPQQDALVCGKYQLRFAALDWIEQAQARAGEWLHARKNAPIRMGATL